MMSFGKIVMEEGGWQDKSAIRRALFVVERATRLGAPFVDHNPWTRDRVFRYIVNSSDETFRETWKIEQQWQA